VTNKSEMMLPCSGYRPSAWKNLNAKANVSLFCDVCLDCAHSCFRYPAEANDQILSFFNVPKPVSVGTYRSLILVKPAISNTLHGKVR